jgi:hypothetical protein
LSSAEPKKRRGTGFFLKYYRLLADARSPIHHKLITFLFFVVISACFWLVRSLGLQYETTVTYPVRYVDFPANKVLTGDVPDRLVLRVRASGFSILKCRLNMNIIPLKFDVNAYTRSKTSGNNYIVLTETIKDRLSEELDQMRILGITPDTLSFQLSDIVSRKVPVIPLLNIDENFFQKQFTLNGNVIVNPDSITISGPENIIEKLKFVSTVPVSYANLHDTVTNDWEIEPVKSLTYSSEKVKVTIPVDRFTEVEESLTIGPLNVPDSLNMIAIPGQVKVTYHICLSNYQYIMHNPLVPRINFRDVGHNPSGRLNVFLSDTPQVISNLRFFPQEVEYLITRR